jgi:hypothetical protein
MSSSSQFGPAGKREIPLTPDIALTTGYNKAGSSLADTSDSDRPEIVPPRTLNGYRPTGSSVADVDDTEDASNQDGTEVPNIPLPHECQDLSALAGLDNDQTGTDESGESGSWATISDSEDPDKGSGKTKDEKEDVEKPDSHGPVVHLDNQNDGTDGTHEQRNAEKSSSVDQSPHTNNLPLYSGSAGMENIEVSLNAQPGLQSENSEASDDSSSSTTYTSSSQQTPNSELSTGSDCEIDMEVGIAQAVHLSKTGPAREVLVVNKGSESSPSSQATCNFDREPGVEGGVAKEVPSNSLDNPAALTVPSIQAISKLEDNLTSTGIPLYTRQQSTLTHTFPSITTQPGIVDMVHLSLSPYARHMATRIRAKFHRSGQDANIPLGEYHPLMRFDMIRTESYIAKYVDHLLISASTPSQSQALAQIPVDVLQGLARGAVYDSQPCADTLLRLHGAYMNNRVALCPRALRVLRKGYLILDLKTLCLAHFTTSQLFELVRAHFFPSARNVMSETTFVPLEDAVLRSYIHNSVRTAKLPKMSAVQILLLHSAGEGWEQESEVERAVFEDRALFGPQGFIYTDGGRVVDREVDISLYGGMVSADDLQGAPQTIEEVESRLESYERDMERYLAGDTRMGVFGTPTASSRPSTRRPEPYRPHDLTPPAQQQQGQHSVNVQSPTTMRSVTIRNDPGTPASRHARVDSGNTLPGYTVRLVDGSAALRNMSSVLSYDQDAVD